jgi:hypothetical protein
MPHSSLRRLTFTTRHRRRDQDADLTEAAGLDHHGYHSMITDDQARHNRRPNRRCRLCTAQNTCSRPTPAQSISPQSITRYCPGDRTAGRRPRWCSWRHNALLLVTPNTHERVARGADVHSSIQVSSVVAEERVKVESPQRSEENRP